MGWLWFVIFVMALFIFGISYVLYRLIEKHYDLDQSTKEQIEVLTKRIDILFDRFYADEAIIDTHTEDLKYLDKCFKEDSERAGLAFAKIENRIRRLGLRIEKLEKGNEKEQSNNID